MADQTILNSNRTGKGHSTSSTTAATAEQSLPQACALVEINERAMLLPALPAEIDDSDLFQFHGVHVQPIPLEDLQGMAHVLFGSLLLGERMDTPQSVAQLMRVIATLYSMLDVFMDMGEGSACHE